MKVSEKDPIRGLFRMEIKSALLCFDFFQVLSLLGKQFFEVNNMRIRQCADITRVELDGHIKTGLRPGIKAVLHDHSRVLLGRLPDGYPRRFNLPGGGIDEGESASFSFVRECAEELRGPVFEEAVVAASLILAEGKLPFPRDGMIGKYEYVICLFVPSLEVYTAKEDSKLVLYSPLLPEDALAELENRTDMHPASRELYLSAVRQLYYC
jgi:8-oxo-dGTP pyrophosphatase MutT (NUDIX family)